MEISKPDLVGTIGGDFEYLERSILNTAKARGMFTVDIASSIIGSSFLKKGFSNAILKGRLNALSRSWEANTKKYIFYLKHYI